MSQSGPEGGGDGPRHIDKDVYELEGRIQQCGKVHASHAVCARKVRRADTLSQALDWSVIADAEAWTNAYSRKKYGPARGESGATVDRRRAPARRNTRRAREGGERSADVWGGI